MFDWFGNRTQSNWDFLVSSITELNRTNRTQSILFDRKTKRIQFQFRIGKISLYLKQFENKNISIDPELTKILIV